MPGPEMKLITLPHDLTVCKLSSTDGVDLAADFYFLGKTGEEISLVCRTACVPPDPIAREDGWRGFRVEGILDFSLIGILAGLSAVLADNGIGIFAVSTYNTDYILVKKNDFTRAAAALEAAGYPVEAGENTNGKSSQL